MSCCGGNCGCGSSCKCGNGCGGCKMYQDMMEKTTPSDTMVLGFAAETKFVSGSEMSVVAAESEDHGCKCGSNCTCDPCTCK